MLLKTISCGVVACCGVTVAALHLSPSNGCPGARLLSLTSTLASAGDKKDDKSVLVGTWSKKDAELKIVFADKDVLKLFLHGENANRLIVVVCDCKADKDRLVKARVTGFEGKEEIRKAVAEKLPVGREFSFKWTTKGDTAKLEDLNGEKIPEIFKNHMEGDFEKK
ncbi:MAG TPA: hypothetical protein VKE94_11745 [Gemmataceae bacterium]|nr:hypothetical protein [Gemmataceae bacterium]